MGGPLNPPKGDFVRIQNFKVVLIKKIVTEKPGSK